MTEISKHIAKEYQIFSIVYNNNNEKTKFFLEPAYLISLLKNDTRLQQAHSTTSIKPIKNYTYFTLGSGENTVDFTISVNVTDTEVSVADFIEKYIMPKYSESQYDLLKKAISLTACTKSLLLSLIYILYYDSEKEDDQSLSFLDGIENCTPIELYDVFLNKLNEHLSSHVLNIDDYITDIDLSKMSKDLAITTPVNMTIENKYNLGKTKDYTNTSLITATGAYLKEITNISTDVYYERYFDDESITDYKYNQDGEYWSLKVTKFPKRFLQFKNGKLINLSTDIIVKIPKGVEVNITFNSKHATNPVVILTEDLIINPGASVSYKASNANMLKVAYNYYLTSGTEIYVYKKTAKWYDELQSDRSAKYLSFNDNSATSFDIVLNNTSKCTSVVFFKDLQQLIWDSFGAITGTNTDVTNMVYNNTKNITITFPVGFKYSYTGKITNYVLKSKVAEKAITAAETVVKTVASFVKNMTSKVKRLFGKSDTTTTLSTETITWYEKITETFTNNHTLEEAITITPGQVGVFPREASELLATFSVDQNQTIQIQQYNPDITDNQISNTAKLDLEISILIGNGENNIEIDDDDNVFITVATEYYSGINVYKKYTGTAKLQLINPKFNGEAITKDNKTKITNNNEYQRLLNFIDAGNNTNITKKLGAKLTNMQSNTALYLKTNAFLYANQKLTDIVFKVDTDKIKYLKITPQNCILSTTNNVALENIIDVNIQENKNELINDLLNLLDNKALNRKINLNKDNDIIYHVTSMQIKPAINVTFINENGKSRINIINNSITYMDIETILNYTNFNISFDSVLTETDKSKKKIFTHGILDFDFSKTFEFNDILTFDLTDYNIYYYNGQFYRNK